MRLCGLRMMASDSRIGAATTGDAAEIARLVCELGYEANAATIAGRLDRLMADPAHGIFVARASDTALAGWIDVEHRCNLESGSRAEIVGLIVDPHARRSGVGGALVCAAESWASARGLGTICVRSNVVRSASHQFYTDCGYQTLKTQHVYAKAI